MIRRAGKKCGGSRQDTPPERFQIPNQKRSLPMSNFERRIQRHADAGAIPLTPQARLQHLVQDLALVCEHVLESGATGHPQGVYAEAGNGLAGPNGQPMTRRVLAGVLLPLGPARLILSLIDATTREGWRSRSADRINAAIAESQRRQRAAAGAPPEAPATAPDPDRALQEAVDGIPRETDEECG
jgi:hypothetical protein